VADDELEARSLDSAVTNPMTKRLIQINRHADSVHDMTFTEAFYVG